MMKKALREKEILELRRSGISLNEIGLKYNISRERVRQICGNRSYCGVLSAKLHKIPYLGLRHWLEENKYSMSEVCEKMGYSTHDSSRNFMSQLFCGKRQLTKNNIDKLLKITNMTYEELFKEK